MITIFLLSVFPLNAVTAQQKTAAEKVGCSLAGFYVRGTEELT